MDHRCLYGHKVSDSLVHAVSTRTCPTCGAATVSLAGYHAARTLAREGGMEAVAAFNAIRLIERDWALSPLEVAESPAQESGRAPDVVVLDDVDVADADAAPRVRPVARPRAIELAPADAAFFKED
jgi:hypothetical protein